jgi:hypothetical protein
MSTCGRVTRGFHPDEESPQGYPQVLLYAKVVKLPDVPGTNLASYVNVVGEQL